MENFIFLHYCYKLSWYESIWDTDRRSEKNAAKITNLECEKKGMTFD